MTELEFVGVLLLIVIIVCHCIACVLTLAMPNWKLGMYHFVMFLCGFSVGIYYNPHQVYETLLVAIMVYPTFFALCTAIGLCLFLLVKEARGYE